jgi:hypothetical protein
MATFITLTIDPLQIILAWLCGVWLPAIGPMKQTTTMARPYSILFFMQSQGFQASKLGVLLEGLGMTLCMLLMLTSLAQQLHSALVRNALQKKEATKFVLQSSAGSKGQAHHLPQR